MPMRRFTASIWGRGRQPSASIRSRLMTDSHTASALDQWVWHTCCIQTTTYIKYIPLESLLSHWDYNFADLALFSDFMLLFDCKCGSKKSFWGHRNGRTDESRYESRWTWEPPPNFYISLRCVLCPAFMFSPFLPLLHPLFYLEQTFYAHTSCIHAAIQMTTSYHQDCFPVETMD